MASASGQPLQIVRTGDSSTDCFELVPENLDVIISKIPRDTKVAVVAVVGAFRTGKSFLLNFFLRYLRASSPDDLTQAWMVSEGEELTEGNLNEGWSIVDSEQERKVASFQWRGGEQRQTTGIWMWSEPFIRTSKANNGEPLAVLLMDTQGMFDNETTMTVTAQIFGLSTLVSSFQIYNVDKRIQEDNLQHLALFSEYGRMALLPQDEAEAAKDAMSEKMAHLNDPDSIKLTTDGESLPNPPSPPDSVVPPPVPVESAPKDVSSTGSRRRLARQKSLENPKRPFQRLQFLVRDWQHFETEYNEGDGDEVFEKAQEEMQSYLAEVLRPRALGDLKSTREHIVRCFEKLDCFLMPHPGFSVVKKTYDGAIGKISPDFRAMVNKYVRYVFDSELQSKEINGRFVTGLELKTYFEVYVNLFKHSDSAFPKAMTMLEATSEANNRNAYDASLAAYKSKLEAVVGEGKAFVKESELKDIHRAAYENALNIFDERANMGADEAIDKMRNALIETLESEKARYFTTNGLRNPFKDLEFYVLPVAIAVGSWIMSVLTDISCSTDFCERVEDTFVNIYFFILFVLIVLGWQHIRSAFGYIKAIAPELFEHIQNGMTAETEKKRN